MIIEAELHISAMQYFPSWQIRLFMRNGGIIFYTNYF